jgi:hypothetical protein
MNPLYEVVGNLHNHTTYSDGHGSHDQIALAAIRAGLDFVVVTDHNILVKGLDGYRTLGDERVLLLVGEEVHDPNRKPQKNHLLIYETQQEMFHLANSPQRLIEATKEFNGLAFIAHPHDPEAEKFNEIDLSWEDWEVEGFHGIELWNFMSEFKSLLSSYPNAIYYAFNPSRIAHRPFDEVLTLWDQQLAQGKQVVAIGGADAHELPASLGPLKRTLFPYEFHYRTINTHVILDQPFAGDYESDRKLLFGAIRRGNCFVGYDYPASTRGFRFTAQGDNQSALMGDVVHTRFGLTLQIRLPQKAHIRLVRDGEEIKSWRNRDAAVQNVTRPGAYRVEALLHYKGKWRGWIYSNPIYLRAQSD